MDKQKLAVGAVAGFVLVFGACVCGYWLGGMGFVRGGKLAEAYCISMILGLCGAGGGMLFSTIE